MGYCIQMTASAFSVSTENTGRVLAIMKKYPYRFELDNDGNISGISFIGFCLSDEFSAFQRAAQYILDGSYIEMRGEDGDRWRWVFQDGLCKNISMKRYWNDHMRYDPMTCAQYGCGHCSILDKPNSPKKTNVYYDLKKSYVQKGQGFLPDETVVSITKGIKLLRASETVCEAIVKHCKKDIEATVRLNNHSFCFFGGSVEVLNLRYERRESRDLLQDLRDVAVGIAVVHESDLKKAEKEAKHSRRIASQHRREEYFRKLIRTKGYENLSASDRRRADKHLSSDEIEKAEHIFKQSLLPPPPDMQLSLEVGP